MPAFRPQGRIRLQSRLLVAFISLVTVAIALVILVMDSHQKRTVEDLHLQKGMAIGHSLSAAASGALLSYNYVALQQLTQRAAEEEGVRYVIVLDKEGIVAGYSGRREMQGRRLEDPLSTRAAQSDWTLVQSVPNRERGRPPGLDIAVPVYVEGSPQKWGVVRVGLSLDEVHEARSHTRLWGLGTGLGVLVPAVLVGLLLARHITGPLKRLLAGTQELARGNFDYRVGVKTGDEFEDLSRQFEGMARDIQQKQLEVESTNQELAELNTNLEDQVVARTRELVEAEEKYRILVEQSPNSICIIQEEHLVFINQAFCDTFGYSAEELEDVRFELGSLLDPEDQGSTMKFWAQLLEGSTSDVRREVLARNRDGARLHLDVRSTVISYRGAPALEAILVDITEQRELQDRAVSYERLRALGEMAGGVAHDFNNVLGAILGRAQLLQQFECEPRVRKGLQVIEKAAQDGSETVKRIQDFTRVRTEKDFNWVNLNVVLEDVLEMTRSRWVDDAHRQGKKIEIGRELGVISDVMGHISELREVFTNLVLNAVDAIPSEGRITVRTMQDGDRVQVTVSDTGDGMTPEVQRRLFDPFFTTKGTGGTGLGMSIVYGIIRRHGAAIEVHSQPHEGTEFRIGFPAVAQEAETPREEPDEEALVGSGRILVADDEPEIRSLVADILQEAGYEVEAAACGLEAVEMAQYRSYDVVITDLGMPDITGWEVARAVRETQPTIGLILMTGWAASLDPKEVEENGVDRTLRKPFEMEELLRGIHEVVGAIGLRRTA